jgi:hypothetical protein
MAEFGGPGGAMMRILFSLSSFLVFMGCSTPEETLDPGTFTVEAFLDGVPNADDILADVPEALRNATLILEEDAGEIVVEGVSLPFTLERWEREEWSLGCPTNFSHATEAEGAEITLAGEELGWNTATLDPLPLCIPGTVDKLWLYAGDDVSIPFGRTD